MANIDNLKKYETTVRTRVECDEKAFHIVNKLIDGTVDGPYLIKCGKLISRDYYNDVVEERAISYLCGYPLCNKTLKDIPKKQYHISTSTNKVYDISERKNFCSNQCLKASKHFTNQISESPLWVRSKEQTDEIKLLPHTGIRGIVGSEVVGISPKKLLEDEIKKLEELDIRSTPSSKNSDKKKAKPSLGKETTTRPDTEDGNKTKSLQTSRADKKPIATGDSEHDVSTPQYSINGFKDRKSIESEQPLERDKSVTVNRENNALGINTDHNSKESPLLSQNDKLSGRQEVSGIKGSNKVVTFADEEKHSKAGSGLVNMDNVGDCERNKEEAFKMDRLMKLLLKRKAVLSGMVDIVTAIPDCASDNTQIILSEVTSDKEERVFSQTDTDKNTLSQSFPTQNSSNASQLSLTENLSKTLAVKPSSSNDKLSSRKSKLVPRSPLEHIGAILKTWITEGTTAYVKSSSLVGHNEGSLNFSDPRVQRGYADLCQRLDAQQKDFEVLLNGAGGTDLSEGDSGKASKSIPDYDALKIEAEAFQLKVTEFMTGNKPQPEDKKKDDEQKDDEQKDAVIIPNVDAYNQKQIRIKIVLDRLDKFLPNLLTPLHLSVQDVSTFIREIVHTFRLEKDNIMFKPSEWTLVAIFIMKMLGRKNKYVAAAFTRESAIRYFTILLTGIGQTVADLDVVTDDILSS